MFIVEILDTIDKYEPKNQIIYRSTAQVQLLLIWEVKINSSASFLLSFQLLHVVIQYANINVIGNTVCFLESLVIFSGSPQIGIGNSDFFPNKLLMGDVCSRWAEAQFFSQEIVETSMKLHLVNQN